MIFLSACQRDDAERALRATLKDMQQAIEEKEPKQFLRHVDAGFNGASVNSQTELDYAGLRQLLTYHFLRNARVRVTITHSDLQIAGARARVTLNATLSGGEGIVPQRVQAYRIDTDWIRADDTWVLTGARWQPQ